ncbi:MAG: tyrosine recombinase [Candidatus Promineifilaceae bacterium]|nr:tyrosine recombinase [Candidatus Promineifilaceae bacterium]
MEQQLQTFLVFLKQEYRYSDNTVAAYRNDLTQFYDYLQKNDLDNWADVTPDIINQYVTDLKQRKKPYAPSSIARKVAAVKSFYNYLHSRNLVAFNPTENIESPKVEKRLPKTLAAQEIADLLRAPARGNTPKHLRDLALLNLLYATGMRVSEVVNLQMDNVDLPNSFIMVTMSDDDRRGREVPLDKNIKEILASYLSEGRPYLVKNPEVTALFLNHRGQQLTRQGLWLIIKSYAREAELNSEVTPHTLRHSFAQHKLNSGSDLEEVQKLLGHANISTTQIYTQIEEDMEQST